MWEYISILRPTPANIFITALVFCLFFCLGALGGICSCPKEDTLTNKRLICGGLMGMAWGTFLTWITVGKSFWWSAIIGNWWLGK